LAGVGHSLANASRLAIQFIEAHPNIAQNITISLRDTGSTVQGATAAANAAVSEGARLILGPLRTDQVTAAGAVARSAGLPLIGFSNNPAAAGPGVYLLSVLPDMEMKRSMGWLMAQGRRGIAGVFPATEFGQAQELAFRQQAVAAGFAPQAIYTFSSAGEAQQIVSQALPQIQKGMIDTLFLPDQATAPSFGLLLAQAGISGDMVQIVGSADWEGDPTIAGAAQLSGAIYPAVDPAGMIAISADYQRQFGTQPHALATIAYTATILANVNTLSMANPPYNPSLMTNPTGFNGRDGVFRFLGNGRSEYALAIKRIAPGGAQILEGARL
jgi:branched-chain amino acid transport system substrate-binding protein